MADKEKCAEKRNGSGRSFYYPAIMRCQKTRGPKGKDKKGVNKHTISKVDQYVKEMVAGDIEATEVIVYRKSEKTENPCEERELNVWRYTRKCEYPGGLYKIAKVLDSGIVHDIRMVIEMKWDVEGLE